MEDELEPETRGEVETAGDVTLEGRQAKRMCKDIERHGEVHATFEHVEGEVECRLGTTLIDYENGTIEVFDGDQYRPFAINKLVTWRVPMDVFHH